MTSSYAWPVHNRPQRAPGELTFDEELLIWLGDEPRAVRAADAGRIRDIANEFARGFDALAQVGPAVTVFGSALTHEGHPHYALVRDVSAHLGRAGYAIITGGGPGLMEAANRGAQEVGAPSIGCNIELPSEQALNRYLDIGLRLRGTVLAEGHIDSDDLAVLHVVKRPSEVCEIVDRGRRRQREQGRRHRRRGSSSPPA